MKWRGFHYTFKYEFHVYFQCNTPLYYCDLFTLEVMKIEPEQATRPVTPLRYHVPNEFRRIFAD
jgi:hypothetical protein